MNLRFLNIPIRIHPTFWIFLIFFTGVYREPTFESLILGVVLIFSLLVHEYGHALTALYFGGNPTINLEFFGGNAQYFSQGMTPKQQFLITLGGPLVEALLIPLSYYLLKWNIFYEHPYIQYFLYATLRLNIIWCLLNLLPVLPLDGGRISLYLLEKRFGEAGQKASILLGIACVVVAAPYLFFLGFYIFAALLVYFGFQHVQIFLALRSVAPDGNPFQSYSLALEAIQNNELDKAKRLLGKLLKTQESSVRDSAIESLACLYMKENENQKAYDLLLKVEPERLKEGKVLLCSLAFEQKNFGMVSKYSREIYEMQPTFNVAFLNSMSFGYLNEAALAGGWLFTASQFGSEQKAECLAKLSDPAYDAVRESAVFQSHVARIQNLQDKQACEASL